MDTQTEFQGGTSPEEEPDPRPPAKRARVNLACQRCKTRKQKCDGIQPSCAQCKRMDVECRYIMLLTPKPQDKKIYIAALEDRIAQLESYLSSIGQAGVGDDHWKQAQSFQAVGHDEVDPLLSAVRDLSLSASGHYVGGTSTITLGRLLGSVINSQKDVMNTPKMQRPEARTDQDHNPRTISSETLAEMMGPMFVTPVVAKRLLEGFLKHIATRFPVVHTPWIRELHERKDIIDDVYEESMLHLVYATGGRFLETTGETGNFFSDQHFEAALQHIDYILEFRDTRSVSYLLLLAIYCLRSPRDPGAWNFARLAMTPCIELGLHRRSSPRERNIKSELEKRLFWSCYYLDREVSMALGRPPAISDYDIDVELPLDINEDISDPSIIHAASRSISDMPAIPATSLTSFIHHLRLKRIESEIQSTIYRVSSPVPADTVVIQAFLDRLSAWEQMLPGESRRFEDSELQPYDGIEAYMVAYHKVVRLLLYPSLFTSPLNTHYLHLCALSCAGVCQTYKRLHHSMNFGPSPLSLQSIFLAGLTLLYCAWLSSHHSSFPLNGPLTDCSIMLYVMTERWPLARKYRDVFERIKEAVMDIIAGGSHSHNQNESQRTRQHIPRAVVDLTGGLEQGILGNANQDLEQMIGDMIGGSGNVAGGFEEFDFRDLGAGNEWHLMNMVGPSQNDVPADSWGAVRRL